MDIIDEIAGVYTVVSPTAPANWMTTGEGARRLFANRMDYAK